MASGFTPVDFANRVSATAFHFKVVSKNISATESIANYSSYWQNLSATVSQDVVLPDATTLTAGWGIVIKASGTAGLNIKTYHATTPVLLHTVDASKAWEFVLLDNSTAAGTWQKVLKADSEQAAAARFTQAFNATTDWGSASGGFYTITIAAASHLKGEFPDAQAWYDNGTAYESNTIADVRIIKTTGAVELKATSTPDNRFAGLLFIQ